MNIHYSVTKITDASMIVNDMIKNQRQQYGYLTSREVGIEPWHTISVDLIGP